MSLETAIISDFFISFGQGIFFLSLKSQGISKGLLVAAMYLLCNPNCL